MSLEALWQHVVASVSGAANTLGILTILFFSVALIFKGRRVLNDMRLAYPEFKVNIGLHAWNLLVFLPIMVPAVVLIEHTISQAGFVLIDLSMWGDLPNWFVAILALFVADLVNYIRHRIEHWSVLWPMHAVHHSDKRVTWVTLFRLHPLNHLTTLLADAVVLALLGFPAHALVFMGVVRTVYGAFIHMDLPWTYGPLGKVFVSPAMHRWHHVLSGPGVGKNFSTVFAFFDWIGGTLYLPGPCRVPLGVEEDMGRGVLGQLWHPFKTWGRAMRGQRDPG